MKFRFQVYVYGREKILFHFSLPALTHVWGLLVAKKPYSLFQTDIGHQHKGNATTLCGAVGSRECIQESSSFNSIGTYLVIRIHPVCQYIPLLAACKLCWCFCVDARLANHVAHTDVTFTRVTFCFNLSICLLLFM